MPPKLCKEFTKGIVERSSSKNYDEAKKEWEWLCMINLKKQICPCLCKYLCRYLNVLFNKITHKTIFISKNHYAKGILGKETKKNTERAKLYNRLQNEGIIKIDTNDIEVFTSNYESYIKKLIVDAHNNILLESDTIDKLKKLLSDLEEIYSILNDHLHFDSDFVGLKDKVKQELGKKEEEAKEGRKKREQEQQLQREKERKERKKREQEQQLQREKERKERKKENKSNNYKEKKKQEKKENKSNNYKEKKKQEKKDV